MFTNESDYIVEQYIKPNKVRKPLINDERADLLGNFDDDDTKFKKKKSSNMKPSVVPSEENPFADEPDESEDEVNIGKNDESDEQDGDSGNGSKGNATIEKNQTEDSDSKDPSIVTENEELRINEKKAKKSTSKSKQKPKSSQKKLDLTDEQVKSLMRGCSKKDRFVLYITNLNYSTTRESLTEFFGAAGAVKSVRVPKVRRSAFAFVEMSDIDGFKNALTFHNRTLDDYNIKVQISEAGKKKSANKKNILKQKNRKLAEMRNEAKQFQRSGKGYDKTIKKEIHQRKMQQNRRLARKNKSINKK